MPAGEAGRKTQNLLLMKKRSPCDLGNKFTPFFAPCQGVGQKKKPRQKCRLNLKDMDIANRGYKFGV
jgi:hypothetical protein